MSIRYLEDYPNWNDLLEEYWGFAGLDGNMYSRMKIFKTILMKSRRGKTIFM